MRDLGPVGHSLDDLLDLAGADKPRGVQREIGFEYGPHTGAHGYDTLLAALPIGTVLAFDR